MSISAKEAATLTGMSKQAIIKSINLGKISAVKDVDGSWQIEPVELFRHYKPLSTVNGNGIHGVNGQVDERIQAVDTPSVDTLQVEVRMLRELVDAKDVTISLLTNENTRLTAVVAQLAPPKAKTGWWQRLLGG